MADLNALIARKAMKSESQPRRAETFHGVSDMKIKKSSKFLSFSGLRGGGGVGIVLY